jgi:uncharacterized protein
VQGDIRPGTFASASISVSCTACGHRPARAAEKESVMTATTTSDRETVRDRSALSQLVRFTALAFTGAWLVGGIATYVLDLGQAGLGIGVLMVAVAALVCARREDGSVRPLLRQVVHWRVPTRWYAAALGLPFLALGGALLLASLLGTEGTRPEGPGLSLLLLLPLYVLFFGGPEELGWRGYALPRLQRHASALVASLVLACIWMLWHAPLFFLADVPGFSELPVLPYLTVGVASSVVYTWLYNSSGGSILLAMLLHAAKNLSLAWLVLTADFAAYAVMWVLFAVVLVAVYGPLDLARRPRQRTPLRTVVEVRAG